MKLLFYGNRLDRYPAPFSCCAQTSSRWSISPSCVTHAIPVTCAARSERQPSCDALDCPTVVRQHLSTVHNAIAGFGDIDIVERR